MKLYVGNLAYSITESDLTNLFKEHGDVQSAKIITDRESGRSKGFGFVEMGSKEEGLAAIEALNGKSIQNRQITVNEARPQTNKKGGGRPGGGRRDFNR
jgi:cold-inducible RNA-binding protein